MSRLRKSKPEYIEEYTSLDWCDGTRFRKIVTNFGQSFFLTDDNRIFLQGFGFDGDQISKIIKRQVKASELMNLLGAIPYSNVFIKEEKPYKHVQISLSEEMLVRDIDCGLGSLLILDNNDHLWVFGDNRSCSLGVASKSQIDTITEVDFGESVKQISVSSNTTLCLTCFIKR